MRIFDLADPATVDRNSRLSDSVGAMLRELRTAADPDVAFQQMLRDAGYFHHRRSVRRFQIKKLATAFGVTKPEMKRYLLAAGLVNAAD